jgi:hypothetical protein
MTGASYRSRGDQVLRYAALLFAAGLALHTADHLRRGTGVLTPEVLWGGMVVTVAGVIAITAVLTRHRLAPTVAAAVGFSTAIGVSASHLLPHWSSFSDAFPGSAADALSWAAVSIEIASAIMLGAAAVYAMRPTTMGARDAGAWHG